MSYTIKGMDRFVKLSEQIPKEPEAWTCDEVSEWLRLIEMDQYVENFKAMSIDGWLIFEIEEDDLINDLKVSAKLHRKKIMKGIQILKEYKSYIQNNYTNRNLNLVQNESTRQQVIKTENAPIECEDPEPQSQRIEEEKNDEPNRMVYDEQTAYQNSNQMMFRNNSNNNGKYITLICF
jgi:hypothetical protein